MEYLPEKKQITLNRELSDLDIFALDFLKILEKYAEYVIISGYISIVLGRTRATEDIDIFIKPFSKEKFSQLYKELKANDFWCLNAESEEEIFSYLADKLAIRFARVHTSVPNFEIKFPKDNLNEEAFKDSLTLILPQGKIKISSIEMQIAFKRYYLCSDKDKEDASHLENLFKNKLDINKINKYKEQIKLTYKLKNVK